MPVDAVVVGVEVVEVTVVTVVEMGLGMAVVV